MSEKPLIERLQVKGERRLATIDVPDGLAPLFADAPTGDPGRAEVVLLFVQDRAAVGRQLGTTASNLSNGAILWLAYPKLTSRLAGDLNRDGLRAAVQGYNFDTVSQIAIDGDWSALRLKRMA